MRYPVIPKKVKVHALIDDKKKPLEVGPLSWFRGWVANATAWTQDAEGKAFPVGLDLFCAIEDKLVALAPVATDDEPQPEPIPGKVLELTDAEHEILERAVLTLNIPDSRLRPYHLRLGRWVTTAAKSHPQPTEGAASDAPAPAN